MENYKGIFKMNNNQTNRQPNLDRYSRRRRKRKKNIKIALFLITVILVFALLVWVFVSLLSSVLGDDESISSEPNSSSETSVLLNTSSQNEISGQENVSSEEESSIPEIEEKTIDWNLILVNSKNLVPDDFELNLKEVEGEPMRGGVPTIVDERIIEPLQQMLADARAEGILPKITSAYRSKEDQIAVMEEYINDYIADGMTREQAEAEARNWVALPGASEHHTGLAVDISTADWSAQGADVVWAWLKENCWKYGFILRYTEEWASVTGTSPEPWHFRYVGTEHAKAITDSGLPYEQYYEQYIKID